MRTSTCTLSTACCDACQRRTSCEYKLKKYWKEAYDACVELFLFFRGHRLYFSKQLVDKMGGLIEGLIEPSEAWINTFVGTGEHQEEYSKVAETWNSKKAEIDEASQIMEEEFRKLLGSEHCSPLERSREILKSLETDVRC